MKADSEFIETLYLSELGFLERWDTENKQYVDCYKDKILQSHEVTSQGHGEEQLYIRRGACWRDILWLK